MTRVRICLNFDPGDILSKLASFEIDPVACEILEKNFFKVFEETSVFYLDLSLDMIGTI